MKPLYTKEEYNNARSCVKLPLECYQCGNTFYVEKKFIKSALKLNINRNKYCTPKCGYDFNTKRITKGCAQCGTPATRDLNQIKKARNGNIFCTQSCAATYNNTHKTKGTRRSKLEVWVENNLPPLYSNLEFKFNDKETINSELDIYLPSLNLAFELQGIFHFQPIYGLTKLAQIQANDKLKLKLCQDKNIELIQLNVSDQKIFTSISSQHYLNIICDHINLKLNK